MGWQAGWGNAVDAELLAWLVLVAAVAAGVVASRFPFPRPPRSCTPEPHDRRGVSEVSIAGDIWLFRACTSTKSNTNCDDSDGAKYHMSVVGNYTHMCPSSTGL